MSKAVVDRFPAQEQGLGNFSVFVDFRTNTVTHDFAYAEAFVCGILTFVDEKKYKHIMLKRTTLSLICVLGLI